MQIPSTVSGGSEPRGSVTAGSLRSRGSDAGRDDCAEVNKFILFHARAGFVRVVVQQPPTSSLGAPHQVGGPSGPTGSRDPRVNDSPAVTGTDFRVAASCCILVDSGMLMD